MPNTQNAASVHNTCLDKIVCYLQRTFNRNRKLKQQVSKLHALERGVCSKIKVGYVTCSSAFSSRYANTRSSNFHQVVLKHTEGMVGSIIWFLLEIYLALQAPAVKEF